MRLTRTFRLTLAIAACTAATAQAALAGGEPKNPPSSTTPVSTARTTATTTKGKLHAVARPTGTRGRRANGYFAAAMGRPTKTAPPTPRPVNDQ